MPLKEFWYGDPNLLEAYQIAYYRKVDYEAWKYGAYVHCGVGIVVANTLKKKGQQAVKYPQWENPIKLNQKPKLTKENLEETFRQEQIDNNSWLRNLLQKQKR